MCAAPRLWHASPAMIDIPRADPRAGLSCEVGGHLPQKPGTFEVLAREGDARAGRLWTAHGPIDTPCFMPVGTRGAVRTLSSPDLEGLGASVVLANTYHLMLRPGARIVEGLGRLHRFMG